MPPSAPWEQVLEQIEQSLQQSLAAAAELPEPEADAVAVHDAVRPCLTEGLINAVFAQAAKTGAAMLAVPVTDTVKRVDAQQQVQETLPRQGLWLAQTPP